jgi:hypothetical protein
VKCSLRVSLVAFSLLVGACQAPGPPPLIMSTKSAVELRAMQSRAFDTIDRFKTIRAVVATLQDLGYTIDKAEPEAGTVSATKLAQLRITATVNDRGERQMIVRSNAIVKMIDQQESQVDDPEFYQKFFFEPLAKAMFLTALQVEDAPTDASTVQPPAAPDAPRR